MFDLSTEQGVAGPRRVAGPSESGSSDASTLRSDVSQHGIIGEHPTMRRVFELVERYAPTRSSLLLMGESGTGKELVARALHRASDVSTGPFEALNCGAIPCELAESELFGHVRGAFTGAARPYAGAFARADGGTLFLDEIGEMPLSIQPKLLRVLEDGLIRPVGDDRHRCVGVRLIAATNRDLEQAAELGQFRLDLYHRLAVGVIQLPSLHDRAGDIPLLVEHFLQVFGAQQGRIPQLHPEVLPFLEARRWSGNVRALRNAVERAVIGGGSILKRRDFEFARPLGAASTLRDGYVRYAGRSFAQLRRDVYEGVLRTHAGNRSAAAMALGIPKSTFLDQLRAMGL